MIEKILSALSGEFLLKRHPNGGGIILARSSYVTFLLYLVALAIKSSTDSGSNLSFSFSELIRDVHATIPWAGAIFAGVYASFYTRYSNQWSYLASTYNQLMAAKCSVTKEQASANDSFINWQAAFASDAFTLHLDRKEIFKGVIDHFLTDQIIKKAILANFSDKELDEFERRHGLESSIKSRPPSGIL